MLYFVGASKVYKIHRCNFSVHLHSCHSLPCHNHNSCIHGPNIHFIYLSIVVCMELWKRREYKRSKKGIRTKLFLFLLLFQEKKEQNFRPSLESQSCTEDIKMELRIDPFKDEKVTTRISNKSQRWEYIYCFSYFSTLFPFSWKIPQQNCWNEAVKRLQLVLVGARNNDLQINFTSKWPFCFKLISDASGFSP